MPSHYEDKLKDVWRAFGTSLSCRVTKGCLWPLYGRAHTFKKFGGLWRHVLQDGCNEEDFSIDFSTEPAKYVRVKDGGLKEVGFLFGKKPIG